MMIIKRIFAALLLSIFVLLPATQIRAVADQQELTVSAAISLKNAFEEIGKLYEARHKGAKVIFNFGASGNLVRQIEGGAPVDVFASAAQKEMDEAEKKGLVLPHSRVNFAGNSIVLITPAVAKIQIKTFRDLGMDQVEKIATGNPKTVPAGRYAEEVFVYYKLLPAIRKKCIYAENVRQVLDYVARGEVDAGVVYSTDAMVKANDIRIVAVAPDDGYRPIIYPAAVVKGTDKEKLAKEFVSFLISNEGRKVLERHGFKLTKKER
ncbi:MAG: molybdate ABC transporter substrate-binding protein [Kiritimatiellae bacterium]|nr:molybdate ABC transporter substrate-binding protein [Kiritimatiellia bacterium]